MKSWGFLPLVSVFIVFMGFFLPVHTERVLHQCEPAPRAPRTAPVSGITDWFGWEGISKFIWIQPSAKGRDIFRRPGYSEVTPGICLCDLTQAGTNFPEVPVLSVHQGSSTELVQQVTPAPLSRSRDVGGQWGPAPGVISLLQPREQLAFCSFALSFFLQRSCFRSGGTQQCFTLLASVYLVKTNLSSLPVLSFALAPAEVFSSAWPEGWS